jgi:hypothetical protein
MLDNGKEIMKTLLKTLINLERIHSKHIARKEY